jgi:menaquinone-dependent protoporphyrinogen oxidase
MRVLVTAASKYGGTAGIAAVIGRVLGEQGIEVTVAPIDQARVEGHDAVVVGSGVYAGQWLKPARDFLKRDAEALRARPVWLFSSGPVGNPPKPEAFPAAARLAEATGARDHVLFAGSIDRRRLSFPDRALVTALRAPEGDFRDWDEIRRWAVSIGTALRAGALR